MVALRIANRRELCTLISENLKNIFRFSENNVHNSLRLQQKYFDEFTNLDSQRIMSVFSANLKKSFVEFTRCDSQRIMTLFPENLQNIKLVNLLKDSQEI